MNFLAHVYLSEDNFSLAIGNLIADRVKGKDLTNFSPMIQKGILLHRKIDAFTDHHSLFKECVSILFPFYRHYSRVIIDMYFDHFLASNWDKYHSKNLKVFSNEFYDALKIESE
ncbi:ACP phosphodiesterase, partial [Flavobacteriaceae bacterium]|nr:ACP phosphodiesterase [Flavobacteriaceae bacterium]